MVRRTNAAYRRAVMYIAAHTKTQKRRPLSTVYLVRLAAFTFELRPSQVADDVIAYERAAVTGRGAPSLTERQPSAGNQGQFLKTGPQCPTPSPAAAEPAGASAPSTRPTDS